MALSTPIEIWPAEVVEVIYSDSDPTVIYGCKVVRLSGPSAKDSSDISVQTAIPLNQNILRIPIVGEVVLTMHAPSSYVTGTRGSFTLYYLDIVSLQNSIHNNALPTASSKETEATSNSATAASYNEVSAGNLNTNKTPEVDENFSENENLKPLQHYIGDVIVSGRYGHSLRFTTTPKSGKFAIDPKFSKSEGSPITILSNTRHTTDTRKVNDFKTETFTDEDNVFVMASGQSLEFEQSSKTLKSADSKKINSWKTEQWGKTPQVLLSSGRIVFNSTQKEIIAFAKNGIALSSESSLTLDAKQDVSINGKKIELGTDADQPVILGNEFKNWMNQLIDAIGLITAITPVGPASPLTATPQWAQIITLKSRISTLLSKKTFTK